LGIGLDVLSGVIFTVGYRSGVAILQQADPLKVLRDE
jgi:hypothetical protein